MQKVILAGSLAALASADLRPRSLKVRKAMKIDREQVKAAKDTEEGKRVEAIIKENEERWTVEGFKGNRKPMFEISVGSNNCNDPYEVEAYELYRCQNTIITDMDNSTYAVSELLIEPGNDGFPIYAFFNGHDCRDWLGYYRMNKRDFGFPATYEPGQCSQMEMDGNPINVYSKASWETREMPDPQGDAVMWGYSGKHKACLKEKFLSHGMMKAGACMMDYYDHDGTGPMWMKFEVISCDPYNFHVMEKEYSDARCTNMVHSESHMLNPECLFDFDYFEEASMSNGGGWSWAGFEYFSYACNKETTPI
jgi:hypothetical protein